MKQKVNEKIKAKNSPYFMKNMNLKIQDDPQTPSRISTKEVESCPIM